MKWVFYFLNTFAFLFLFSEAAKAQTFKVSASYFLRGSPDFEDGEKIGTLDPGSEIEVIDRKQLRNGEALRIRVVGGHNKTTQAGKEYWIYKALKTKDFQTITEAQVTSECPTGDCAGAKSVVLTKTADTNNSDMRKVMQEVENRVTKDTSLPLTVVSSNELSQYSNRPDVQKSLEYLFKKYGKKHSLRTCYRAIREALTLASPPLAPDFTPDGAAINAKDTLKEHGFVNLMDREPYRSKIKSAADAPKGAILVYSTGRRCPSGKLQKILDCGHVEMKYGDVGELGCISDFFNDKCGTMYPKNRLVGVMIKPPGDKK